MNLSPNKLDVTLTAPVSPIIVGATSVYTLKIVNPNNMIPASIYGGSLLVSLPQEVLLLSASCIA